MSGGAQGYALFEYPRRFAWECRSSAEFARRFGTERRCEEWLRAQRWPGGFVCPKCAGGGRWCEDRRGYLCSRCRKFCSLTAGTILHGTKKPISKWFAALFLVVQRGVNARTLQREIGLTYKVAWMWGQKLRSLLAAHAVPADVRDRREKRHRRYEAERERFGPTPRRPRAGVEGPCGCSKLVKRDWTWVDNHPRPVPYWQPPPPLDLNPRRLDIFAHWELLATYWGSVTEKHLRGYLDELSFRMNRRWRTAAESFLTVAPELALAEPMPWKAIVAKTEPAAEVRPVSIFAAC